MIHLTDSEHFNAFSKALHEHLVIEDKAWGPINEKWVSQQEQFFMIKIYGLLSAWNNSPETTQFPWMPIASLCMQGWLKERIAKQEQNNG